MYIIENNLVYRTKEGIKSAIGGVRKIEILPKKIKSSVATNIYIKHLIFNLEQQEYLVDNLINKTINVDNGNVDVVNGVGYFELTSPNANDVEVVVVDGVEVVFNVEG